MSVSTRTNASTQTGGFSSRWAIYALAAFVAAAGLAVFSTQAHAVTPKKGGNLVNDVEFRPRSAFAEDLTDVDQDPHEVIAGRDHCESLVSGSSTPITYAFELTGNPQNFLASEDIMFYATPTDGLPADFECDRDGIESCYSVNDRDIFNTALEGDAGTIQTITIDFDELVNEAVEGLADQDEITRIESAADCHPDDEDAFDQQYMVRLILQEGGTTGTPRLAEGAIRVDTIRPPAPSAILDVTATESVLNLRWEQAEELDAERYHAFWSTEDITGMDIEALVASDAQRAQINLNDDDPDGTTFEGSVGLSGVPTDDPETRVFVAVVSRDEAENFSQPTFAEQGVEVLPVTDFWEGYRQAGGSERGGCTSSGGSVPAGAMGLLVVAGGLLLHRRRRS